MSMENWAVYGHGIALVNEEAYKFLEKNECDECDITDAGACVMTMDDEGKDIIFLDGREFTEVTPETVHYAIVFPLSKEPSLFDRVYNSPKDCVKDVVNNFETFDFSGIDMEKHIAEYQMVEWS